MVIVIAECGVVVLAYVGCHMVAVLEGLVAAVLIAVVERVLFVGTEGSASTPVVPTAVPSTTTQVAAVKAAIKASLLEVALPGDRVSNASFTEKGLDEGDGDEESDGFLGHFGGFAF